MKRLLRFAAGALCLAVLCVCLLTSCTQREEGTPDGMFLAVSAGADFRLYVPATWNSNTDYGISGAYRNLAVQSTVSVVKYDAGAYLSVPAGAERIRAFWDAECLPALKAGNPIASPVLDGEPAAGTLGELNALRFRVSVTTAGKDLEILQVVGATDTAFYVFTLTGDGSVFDELLPDAESMIENFCLAEPYVPDFYVRDPEGEAPEGMQVVSDGDVAYRFYVPASWTLDRNQGIYAAYASDRSSVSVVPYMPETESLSVSEFFAMSEELMQKTSPEYTLLSVNETTLGGRKAYVYDYTFAVGGTACRYRQIVAAYRSMIYSLTYTALPENFDAHLGELDEIVGAFSFR